MYIESHGCSANYADGNLMGGALKASGYELVDSPFQADFLVYNTCGVKGPTENRMIDIMRRAPFGKKIIVTGCLPKINRQRIERQIPYDALLGPNPGSEIVDVIRRIRSGESKIVNLGNFKPLLETLEIRPLDVKTTIPVAYGCTSACTFCATKIARGKLRSYTQDEILRNVSRALKLGIREIWLTATDLICYGWDIDTDLPSLIESITQLPNKFFLRLGMMNPSYVEPLLSPLLRAMRDERVFKFIHLPVQSGNDEVLKSMKRKYSVDQFKRLISWLRAEFPRITIATDIICGFPGETEEHFQNTLNLVRDITPDVVNVSKFHPRPGTAAARMPQVDAATIKRRSQIASHACREIAVKKNREWIGLSGEILVDEEGSAGTWVGRNFAYKPVVLEGDSELLGKFMRVSISDSSLTHLSGFVQ